MEQWAGQIGRPWIGALEATMFTGWIYDRLRPLAVELKVAHPAMLKAIAGAKKKNDRSPNCRLPPNCRSPIAPDPDCPGVRSRRGVDPRS
ncbi:MAG: hypothetical protein WD733_15780 [Bryobacterales bacterium]